ncbi:hypothetical protein AKJ09_00568 [Labilithrix luteola]|uniref:Beta-lactamase n=1 Tax=Labilithrix luteola TaxID=1391654 RepID=A0A0K1PLB1_9BACT|nr:tetratricopeptide repeat protein [Labilithrix luteola]AKU93904.1 hypothetical protein AKJ09_00568 [Labilithrix luteola]
MSRTPWLGMALLVTACTPRERPGEQARETTIAAGCQDAGCTERCDHDDAVACLRLGNDLRGHDDAAALERYERACRLNEFAACAAVGRMYEFAHGAERDDTRAFSNYARSCEGGAMVGCYSAAILLERGQGTTRDVERAHELFAKVCRAGGETACRDARRTENTRLAAPGSAPP